MMTKEIDIKALYEAGVQFGHKTSRWHPKMAEYIHSKRQDSHIINLEKTVEALERALPAVSKIVAGGRKVLFVGTKKQVKEVIKTVAEAVGQPYVTERWIGGTLTNTETINKQIKKLVSLEKRMASGELEKRYSKLEVQRYQEEIDLLNTRYGGIKDLSGKPGAVVVFGAHDEKNAVKEAQKMRIPVFALVDTNTDPTGIDFVIPANDDAIGSVQIIAEYFADAVKEGAKNIKKVEG
ncbi:MAG: 30S ribosomal protein S2 [Candidatus Nomurabacteria bacterium]|jgi:small subunit ribosomal protein S2|nr:30S ribosomal protein S2 [Candidatus Nomurabacteria bacterium]